MTGCMERDFLVVNEVFWIDFEAILCAIRVVEIVVYIYAFVVR